MYTKLAALALFAIGIFSLDSSMQAEEGNENPFFINPGQEQAVLVPENLITEPAGYTVTDYTGALTRSGTAIHAKSSWQIKLNLPAGFYEINFITSKKKFGLLAIPECKGTTDPFFCIDSALSWLTSSATREAHVKLIKRCGFAMARERLSWSGIETSAGNFNWETDRVYDRTRNLYRENQIPLLELSHSVPAFIKSPTGGDYPYDLTAAMQSWKAIAGQWKESWGAMECWNEPDLLNAPADRYVAWYKTLRYSLRSAGLTLPLGGGVFGYLSRPFVNLAALNGLVSEADFISFHYYGNPEGMAEQIARYRQWLKENNRPTTPLWITEAGYPWEGTTQYPTLDQDRDCAMKFSGNASEGKACGLARYFAFVLVDYSEREIRHFGMLDSQGAPLRTMAAYATTTRLLSNAIYIGDLKTPTSSALPIRVFKTLTGQAICVLYTGSLGTSVKLPFLPQSLMGADGRNMFFKTSENIPIPDGIGYAMASLDTVLPLLNTKSLAFQLSQLNSAGSPPLPPSPIILAPVVEGEGITPSVRGYLIKEGMRQVPISLQIANLDHRAHEAKLTLSGQPQTTQTVPALTTTLVKTIIDLSKVTTAPDGTGVVTFKAQSKDVDHIASAAIYLIVSKGLSEYLEKLPYKYAVPVEEQYRWKENANGQTTFEHGVDATWGFSVRFHVGNRWAFPRFTMPQEVDFNRVDGVLIRARCTGKAQVKLMVWSADKKMNVTSFPIIQADGQWHVAYVPLDSFISPTEGMRLGQNLRELSIGVNGLEPTCQVDLSDVYLLGSSK